MSAPPPGRFEVYEGSEGRYCVYDRARRGHFPYEWGSPEEAILEARRLTIEATKTKKSLDLIFEDELETEWT